MRQGTNKPIGAVLRLKTDEAHKNRLLRTAANRAVALDKWAEEMRERVERKRLTFKKA